MTAMRQRAIARPERVMTLPDVCRADRIEFTSGCLLVGGVETRLERFDRGWVVSFAALFADGGVKIYVWKVYPMRQTEPDAVEAIRRRASDFAIVKIIVLGVDRPGEMTGDQAV